jgi:hypothetical protein
MIPSGLIRTEAAMVVQLGELMMILDLHRQGLSITAIARRTGRDPKTVRKYIERGLEPPAYGPRQVGSGVRSACALLLPEPYVHLSAHTALHSSLAHGHSNIMITGGDGTASFAPEDVWIGFRIPPPELCLWAGYHSAQRLADTFSSVTSSVNQPGFRPACLWRSIPAPHQRFHA